MHACDQRLPSHTEGSASGDAGLVGGLVWGGETRCAPQSKRNDPIERFLVSALGGSNGSAEDGASDTSGVKSLPPCSELSGD
jgi:hypothetical protein